MYNHTPHRNTASFLNSSCSSLPESAVPGSRITAANFQFKPVSDSLVLFDLEATEGFSM